MMDTDFASRSAVIALQRRVRALESAFAQMARVRAISDHRLGAFLQAVDTGWGNGPWRAGELIAWASDGAFAGRRAVLDAAAALTGAPVTAHALGLRLSALADSDVGDLRLVRAGAKERGARLWAVVRVRD